MSLGFVSPLFETDIASNAPPGRGADGADSHHRIANNLAWAGGLLRRRAGDAKREARQFTHDEVSDLLLETAARIETVERTHGRLARGERMLAGIIQGAADEAVASGACPAGAQLRLSLDRGLRTPAGLAVPMAVAVGELVANSVRHAHPAGVPCRIQASAFEDETGALVVEVSDDGVGLPEGFDPMTSGGLGLELVRSLAEEMDAALTFEDTGVGLAVRLRLSPPHGEVDAS